MNFDFFDFVALTQTKMNSRIGTGTVAATGKNVRTLTDSACGHKNFRADCVARTFWPSNQAEADPVIVILHHISQQRRSGVHTVNDNSEMTVIQKITDGCAPSG